MIPVAPAAGQQLPRLTRPRAEDLLAVRVELDVVERRATNTRPPELGGLVKHCAVSRGGHQCPGGDGRGHASGCVLRLVVADDQEAVVLAVLEVPVSVRLRPPRVDELPRWRLRTGRDVDADMVEVRIARLE